MKKKNRPSIFDDRRILLAMAVLMAVLSWVVVAGFIKPGNEAVIEQVPIDYRRSEANYKNLDLQIVGDLPSSADVTVTGNDTVIGGLNNTDLTVYADFSSVKEPGIYEIPLRVERLTGGNYEVSEYHVHDSGETTISMEFELLARRTFSVTVRADNVTAAEGYSKDEPIVRPATVELTGPRDELDRIEQVVARISDVEVRDSKKIYPGVPLLLFDADGNELDRTRFTFSSETVEVELPILEEREIGLSVGIGGAPQNFDTEWFQSLLTLSADSVRVAAPSAAFETLSDPYQVGIIDLSTISLDEEIPPLAFSLPEGQGFRNRDQLKTVAVTLDTDDLATRTMDVSNIVVVNGPRNATIRPVVGSVANVTLIGPADEMAALLPEHVTVEVDAYGIAAGSGGQQYIPARIVVTSSNRVFATGSYTVPCSITLNG